jgi:PAS domain S-box-containing protein
MTLVTMLGHPNREALLTANLVDLYARPEDKKRWKSVLERDRIVGSSEVQVYRYDGTVIWLNETIHAGKNLRGRALSYDGWVEDITERKRVEEALHREVDFNTTLVQNSAAFIVAIDAKGRTLMMNETMARTLGYTREEVRGRDFLSAFVPKADREGAAVFFDVLIAESKPKRRESSLLAKDGRELPVEWHDRPVLTPDGDFSYILGVGIDITERKRAEEALRAYHEHLEQLVEKRTLELATAKEAAETANRAKSTFLARMSHDLRTPLNGILGYAQILMRDRSISPQQKNSLNVIERSGRHLLSLINDLLDLAKAEAGKVELCPGDFHLLAFLRSIAELIRVRAEYKGIDWSLELSSDLPEGVRGDERRLRQVLVNLLDNAVKFTDKGGVTLSVSRGTSHVLREHGDVKGESEMPGVCLRFEVSDTGIGVAPEDLQAIYDPFGQVGDQRRRSKGTGLGLSISRNLVELMGGDLQVESPFSRPGGGKVEGGAGSRFWFDVVLFEVDYGIEFAAEPPRQIVGVKGDKLKILVVDDNRESRAVLVDLLSPLGFEVAEAGNGCEGLAKAEESRPHVVLTGLIMPEMDGLELIQRIKESPSLKDENGMSPVVIATSANVYEKDQQKSLSAGSDLFLAQPVEADLLFEQLQRLLNVEWLYSQTVDQAGRDDKPLEFVLPSARTLAELLDRATMGDIEELEEQLTELAQSDEKYLPFVTKLRRLARNFELNRICALLEEYLS